MNTNYKPKSAEPAQQVRDMAEKGTARAQEFYGNTAEAMSEAGAAMQSFFSNDVRGMQEYNEKLAEFAQANAKTQMEFMEKLSGLKSPTEFFEISSKHMQQHFERLTEQGKLLATLAQRIAIETAEPIKSGVAKGK